MKLPMKQIKIALLAVLTMLGIAGCSAGSRIETNLTVNKDLSGVRVMEVAIDSSVFSENFHGDIAALNVVVEQKCPKELKWTYDNSDGTDCYHVELVFSSPEDYKRKVEAITGEEKTVELSAPETIWANGFRVYEGFSSSDLLGWLKEALVEAELVDSSDSSYIFEDGACKLTFNGTAYDAGSSIQVNELQYLPLEKIDLLTNMKDLNSFDRSIIFYIPRESMNVKRAEIEAFLNGNVPEGAVSSWDVYENGTKMTISKENMDVAALNVFDQKVLASDKNVVETAPKAGTEEAMSLFSFANSCTEVINLSSYAGDESGRVKMGYYVKTEDGMELKRDPGTDVTFHVRENETYAGYGRVLSDKFAETTLSFLLEKNYMIQRAGVTTEAKPNDFYQRSITIELAQLQSEVDRAEILSRFQAKAGDYAEVIAQDADGGYALTIVQKGTGEELSEGSEAIFGSGIVIGKAKEKGLMSVDRRFGFYERFRYDDFIRNTTDDYAMTYTVKMGLLDRIRTKGISQDEWNAPEIKGNMAIYTIADSGVNVMISGSSLNLVGLLLWILIIGSAGFLIWNLKKTGVFAMAKNDLGDKRAQMMWKKQQSAAGESTPTVGASQNMQEAAMQEAAVAVAPGEEACYCPECGQPCTVGALFCENCGTKLK